MRQPLILAAMAIATIAAAPSRHNPIADAVAARTRTPANVARDRYRHPAQTLAFFGVEPGDTVVEIWPGGGWYTEILAPLINGHGTLYAVDTSTRALDRLQARDAATYGRIKYAAFPWAAGQPKVPNGSADVVLTFRNVHNWRMGEERGGVDYSPEAFAQMYAMLKHGGTLGIEDHRLPESASAERETSSGYIKVSTVRRLAEAAGFRFAGASEINANRRDTADWPQGVWTLPPTYTLKDVDHARYEAIGESDRMTLRFRKP